MSLFGVVEDVPICKIRQSANQLRGCLENLNELAESIEQHGLLQPIVVRPLDGEYEVVAGNRRLAAARILKLRKISCQVIELSDREAYEAGLVENVQHKTMDPIEEALAFSEYVRSCGWGGVCELAKRIGKSQEYVTKRIQLLKLPINVREEIIRQRITPSTALELLPLDQESIKEISSLVVKNSLTKNETRYMVRASKKLSDASDKSAPQNAGEGMHVDPCSMTSYEKETYLLDKALMRSIAVMKSTLVNLDDIVNSVEDDWILKELLMQYRLIIHGDIDTFLKLRKRLSLKMPRNYVDTDYKTRQLADKSNNTYENTVIHLGAAFLS
jgi:ParB family transcriptional regulator, chromosome partitioning protein